MVINVHVADETGRLDTIAWTSDYISSEWVQVEVAEDFETDDLNPGDYILEGNKLVYSPTVGTIDLLKAQVTALTERNEFLEDCVAEMAEQVYGE